MFRFLMIIVLVPFFASPNGLGDEPPKSDGNPKFLAEFRALQEQTDKQLKAVYAELEKEFDEAKTEADLEKVSAKARQRALKIVHPAVKKALDLVRTHAAEPAAVEPLVWIAGYQSLPDAAGIAIKLLQKHHLTDAKTIDFARRSRGDMSAWVEAVLRAQLASADLAKEQRPRVLFILAVHLQTLAAAPSNLADAGADVAKYVEIYGKERVEALKNLDATKLEDEALRIFTELSQKHANDEIVPGEKIGDIAKSSIFEIKNLSVGKTAPDIEGEDLDGVKFKLSDYRGKVVLLSFWGSWCGPCMSLVPHERELVEKYKEKQFALIGVNSDPDKEKLKKVIQKQQITWRSFWCGKNGPDGELATTWNVNGWPTVYLIDHAGVIRAKNLLGSALDTRIHKLVAEAEKTTRRKN
jgi:thiol-disulfide isomerase/thioredoxin